MPNKWEDKETEEFSTDTDVTGITTINFDNLRTLGIIWFSCLCGMEIVSVTWCFKKLNTSADYI